MVRVIGCISFGLIGASGGILFLDSYVLANLESRAPKS